MGDPAATNVEALRLVMMMAAQETAAARYPEITPAHLLIALSRATEDDFAAAAPAASATIRGEFDHLGIEPKRFRQRMRALLGNAGADPPPGPIHRSPKSKAVFARAQAIAVHQGVPMNVAHLLHAILIGLALNTGAHVNPRDVDCPGCHAKVQLTGGGGAVRCPACGKEFQELRTHQAGREPPDAIPDEL
jgi:hypothetical protein